MKKHFSLIFICLFSVSYCQVNLVPNWSFEYVDTSCSFNNTNCFGGIQVGSVPPWDGYSSDVFNTCSIYSDCDVPFNHVGYQSPHTGNGYAGEIFFGSREYMEVPLDSILKPQHKYCVNFYVNISNLYAVGINNIGMYISNTYTPMSSNLFGYTPQINYTGIISDTLNWTNVSGLYVANGGEQFITIGNFYSNTNTDTVPSSSPYCCVTYMYIDDVSIVDCTDVGADELDIDRGELAVYPNPATTKITIDVLSLKVKNLKILNEAGEIVFQTEIQKNKYTIDVSSFANGIYFAEVATEKGIVRRKFVKQ